MHMAASFGKTDVVKYLAENGADINAATNNGFVPLSYAAWADNAAEMARFLVLSGADVNPDPCENNKSCTCGPNFMTPLHFACQVGKPELVEVLLSSGAKVNLFNADGMTPLHCAVKSGNIEIVKMLIDHGAFLNVREKQQGSTELHFAAAMGYGDIASFLAEKGSCPEMKDHCGKTPLDYAFYYGQKQIGYEMLAAGGNDSLLAEYLTMECPLAKQIPVGEAMVWYLGHSGWAIKTSDHFLVFDYFDNPRERISDHPCLASGCIHPQDLKDQHLTVFSTHSHQDHYNPSMFTWKQDIPETEYVLCFRPDGVSDEYDYIPVNTSAEVDGMNIYVIKSTDLDGGYLVEVDGLVIFHMGDHANGEDELAADFTKEIDLIAEQYKKIDILFGPIRGCSLGTPEQVKKGTYYTLEKLDPALFVPMHSGTYSFEYKKFVEQAQKDGISQPMKYMINKGDRFIYSKGERIVAK
jgi:L-ascorbate metabolism protein UlaG (beta-lactamase superfamily)